NCKLILNGNKDEINKAKKIMVNLPKIPIFEEAYLEWTKNCSQFKHDRGYINTALSDEEENFPLAFSISSYTDIEQTERLLRAIYHPQNLYCIHIDIKSSFLFHNAVRSIANCFPNVWIATKLHKIKWGDISVILPEISCMRDLLKYFKGKYKYFINLTGQEFPLRTNFELVKILKIFNGSNDITGSQLKSRVNYVWKHRWSKTYQQTVLYKTQQKKKPYEFLNLTFYKGETHGLFASKMTEFIIESKEGKTFFDWCKDTGHASEHYWNTLNYNKLFRAPGGYEAKNWVNVNNYQWPCNGKVVRGICIFGIEDVPWLSKRPELFVNKFHLTYDYLGYDCLEEI
ncbi:hypothetical protein HELRODRAFT_141556, partial [Helobdella robusta]|uniref:Protein xylosyltransferase n=1 Tax=Helobdella robusta TaxID=6412 RepID=T1EJ36_HELRO